MLAFVNDSSSSKFIDDACKFMRQQNWNAKFYNRNTEEQQLDGSQCSELTESKTLPECCCASNNPPCLMTINDKFCL